MGVFPLLGGVVVVYQHLNLSHLDCFLLAKALVRIWNSDGAVLNVVPLLGASCLEAQCDAPRPMLQFPSIYFSGCHVFIMFVALSYLFCIFHSYMFMT